MGATWKSRLGVEVEDLGVEVEDLGVEVEDLLLEDHHMNGKKNGLSNGGGPS